MSMAYLSRPNSIPVSWLYIFIVVSESPILFHFFFFLFCGRLDIVHVHKVINLSLWFSKFVVLSAFPKYNWVASLVLEIVMMKAHLPWRCLPGFSPPLKFFLLSIPLFSFCMASVMNFMTLSDILGSTQFKSQSVVDGREFFKPESMYVFRTFSHSVLFRMLFWAIPGVFPSLQLFWILVVLFSFYLSVWSFCYALSVPIFYSKIVLLPLHLVVYLSLCIIHLLVNMLNVQHFITMVYNKIWIYHNDHQ